MTIRYAHTNLIARDWEKLAEFYTAVFGCRRKPPARDQSGDWLARGTGVPGAALRGVHLLLPGHGEHGPTLEIYTYRETEDAAPAPPNRRGLGHLAFQVADVAATAGRVVTAGGALLGEVTRHPVEGVGLLTFVYVRDPEGNLLELQSWELLPADPRHSRTKSTTTVK